MCYLVTLSSIENPRPTLECHVLFEWPLTQKVSNFFPDIQSVAKYEPKNRKNSVFE